MRILLVYPSQLDENGSVIKYTKAYLPPLALAQLAALIPERHEVLLVNDAVEDMKPYYQLSLDLVCITAMTMQAERAYNIADQFRRRGAKVVMGGIHPTVLPDEAQHHTDAVVTGEAELVFEQVLDDAERGSLKEFYHGPPCDLQQLLKPRWEIFNLSKYIKQPGSWWPMMPLFTTRGCPLGCKFCTVTHIYGKSYRFKPVENVLREIEAVNADKFFIVDDNIMASPAFSRELFQALKGKDIHWISQASTTMLRHPELIELAGKAGCVSLFIGIESISQSTLSTMNKGFNKIDHYKELFERLYRANIVPYVSLILGFDQDTPETFKQTLKFLKENNVMLSSMSILTPLPGTLLYEEMEKAGKITKSQWSMYDSYHVVFKPDRFSPEELLSSYWSTFRNFYSMSDEINSHVREQYPSLSKISFFGALSYQEYASMQLKVNLHPMAPGTGRL